ncbi:MAG: DUF1501 domain-containing protein [Proteobacteria bacterium]|nr:DUF1501 domain-containing protein [Pseudomonadota bacterium]
MTNVKPKNSPSQISLALPHEVEAISRRQFIDHGVSLTAFTSLYSMLGASDVSRAAIRFPPQRKLIWINMSGGWDILEVTDPKTNSTSGIDMSYSWGDAKEVVGGDGTKIGRWCSNIANLGTDLLVVRGLAMGTTSHEAGSVYMDTGILSNAGRVNAASIPSIVASESAATIPIIQLSGGSDPMIDRGLLNSVSPVRASNLDLYRSMYPTEADALARRMDILKYLKTSIDGYQQSVGANDRLTDLASAEAKIRVQFEGNVGSKLALTAEDAAPFTRVATGGRQNSVSDAFALAAKLVKNDLVTCVNLGIGGFDTHANQTARMQPIMEQADRLVAVLAEQLRSASKLNSTLIVLYSDFGRTPKVNGSNGRDHWPVGGALMIGGGIAGGRAVGGTDDNLLSTSINLTTGAATAGGTQLSSIHLGGSILSLTLGSSYMQYRPYLTAIELMTRLKS